MSFPELSDQTKFDFQLENIKNLIEDTNCLRKIPNFSLSNPNHFYKKNDKAGWWMATKQIVFRHYIDEYLTILGKRSYIKLYFIDLLSSFGMNKVTKQGGKDQFIFPGTSISAALISYKKHNGFSKIYSNDIKQDKRTVLYNRLKAFNKAIQNHIDIEINTSKNKIDSNQWVLDILKEIRKKDESFNYLMVIDNQGMDIYYETIRCIKEIHDFGDIIITFQDAGIARNLKLHPKKVLSFFGREIPPDTKKNELSDLYVEQLRKIKFGRIEKLKIASKSGFYYTLLFCCRKDVSGDWLEMIKYYRNERFKYWTDEDVKRMWDIAMGKSKTMDIFT